MAITKTYSVMQNVGRAKYVVSFRDGIKKHADGSLFADIEIFSNKRKLASFIRSLKAAGFVPT